MDIPPDILAPPDSVVPFAPVVTRGQRLPFEQLSWQNFERLLYRMANAESRVEHCSTYGRQGQGQQGIDIFARLRTGRYVCWQAKNHSSFSASKLKDAISVFLAGTWRDRTERFVLCVQAGLDDTTIQEEIESQANRLRSAGIVLQCLDGLQLTEKLKLRLELVDDFFGRPWVEHVAGEDAATQLGTRLGGDETLALRQSLGQVYDVRFRTTDPGLTLPGSTTRDIRERFVAPDVDLSAPYREVALEDPADTQDARPEPPLADRGDDEFIHRPRQYLPSEPTSTPSTVRVSVEEWLLGGVTRSLILGSAGLGKSTLLRCMALDFLTSPSTFLRLVDQLGDRIPVLIPFAFWSRLASKKGREVSVVEVVDAVYGASLPTADLGALLIRALSDRRLLLLVDGLDEFAEEQAARTTLMTMETFARTHAVPVIATGRPAGVRRLGMLGDWEMGRLVELSPDQQRRLAALFLKESFADSDDGNDTHSRQIDMQVDRFFNDIDRTSRLRSLAGAPLLLTGLLSMSMRHAILPRTRYQLFQQLVDLLIDVHPRRRATAASEVDSRVGAFAIEDQRRAALSRLAFEIQSRGDDAGISRSDARRILEECLRADDGPGWSSDSSRQGANELTAVNSETSGLLLERGPDELAFCHAAFREHLAGLELSTWSLDDQREFVQAHADDPRWRGPILSMLHSLPRRVEIQGLLAEIPTGTTRNPALEHNKIVLLADAVFSLPSASGHIGRDVTPKILDLIETSPNDAERTELLGLVLDGPRDGPVGEAITERLSSWWPSVSRWRVDMYGAIADWPNTPETLRGLWLGLFDDDAHNRVSAARALAAYARGDSKVRNQLVEVVRSAEKPHIAAAALEAIAAGWSDEPLSTALLESALDAEAFVVQFVAGLSLGRQGDRRDKVKALLLEAIDDHYPRISTTYRIEATDVLAAGWSDDQEISELCWKSVPPKVERALASELATALLLRNHRKDPKVIPWLVSTFKDSERFPFAIHDSVDLIIPVLQESEELRQTADVSLGQLDGHYDHRWTVVAAALKTPSAKAFLLEGLASDGSWKHWVVSALLSGWGLADPDVSRALRRIARSPVEERQYSAHHVPVILEDDEEAYRLLAEVAALAKVSRPDLLVEAFAALSVRPSDAAVVDLVLPHVTGDFGLGGLITHFSRDPRVRSRAVECMSGRDPPLSAIARAYMDDSAVRAAVLRRANPLAARFRQAIALRATAHSEDPALLGLLEACHSESDPHALIQSTIGLAKARAASGIDASQLVESLADQLHATGPDHEERAVAAYAGLLAMGELDTFADATDGPEDTPTAVSLFAPYKDFGPAIELTAERWDVLESRLGDGVAARLQRWSDKDVLDWQLLAPYASKSKRLTEMFIDFCDDPTSFVPAICLGALARLSPRSSLLLDVCSRSLLVDGRDRNLSPYESARTRIAAAELLAKSFSENPETLDLLLLATGPRHVGAGLVGLSIAYPDNPNLSLALEQIEQDNRVRNSWAVTLSVVGAAAPVEYFCKVASFFIQRRRAEIWDFPSVALHAIKSRIEGDAGTREVMLSTAEHEQHPCVLVSVARLFSSLDALDQQSVERLGVLARKEEEREGTPRFGRDVTTNQMRQVLATLREAVVMRGGPR